MLLFLDQPKAESVGLLMLFIYQAKTSLFWVLSALFSYLGRLHLSFIYLQLFPNLDSRGLKTLLQFLTGNMQTTAVLLGKVKMETKNISSLND